MTTNSNITIGIDEVGRGPWAGPLLVSAVALDMNQSYEGLADSKKLTKHRREAIAPYVQRVALGIGLGWVNVPELDQLGMTKALQLGARRAYNQLPRDVADEVDRIVIDGNIKMLDDPRATVMVKADAKVQAVSAASIVAKVARDSYMAQLSKLFPNYGFERHAGYGTKLHSETLNKYGIINGVHRQSFAPIKRLMGIMDAPTSDRKVEQAAGHIAEAAAADYLAESGYEIVVCNWRTPLCEIDIVARRNDDLYFVEVKYRETDQHGDGLAAITPHKLAQMKFAARIYLHDMTRTVEQCNPHLMAVSLSGNPPKVVDIVEING